MEETLLLYAPLLLAVGVAVFLRLRRSFREASEESAALQRRVSALEQRTHELERAQAQIREAARTVWVRGGIPARPAIRPATVPAMSPANPLERAAHSLRLNESQKEIAETLSQLYALNAQLPQGTTVEEKYIAEFDSIVERLERAIGCDLSRWLGIPPQEGQSGAAARDEKKRICNAGLQSRDSNLFRLRVVSLQAFCDYQIYHSQKRSRFVPPPPGAARLLH